MGSIAELTPAEESTCGESQWTTESPTHYNAASKTNMEVVTPYGSSPTSTKPRGRQELSLNTEMNSCEPGQCSRTAQEGGAEC